MSNAIANIITGAINIITLPLSRLQKNRTMARIISKIERNGLNEVITPRGVIKFHSLRGIYTAKRVEKFYEDEAELLEWINHFKSGETLWDIGANIGVYSLYAGLNPGITVYSFEPSGFNFGLLVEHIKTNNMGDRIKPLCVAFDDVTSINNLLMKNTHVGHANNLLDKGNQPKIDMPAFAQATPVFSIDDFSKIFNLPAPDHLKIDVDGNEAGILYGAKKTLSQIKDLMIEVVNQNLKHVANLIEKPIFAAGLKENEEVRNTGSRRNRLYIR